MLSRTDAVERLITLRKQIFSADDSFPAADGNKKEFDQLLLDIISPPPGKENRITEIINLALFDSITPRTAAVAIQELASQPRQQRQQSKNTGAENIELLKERGWNT